MMLASAARKSAIISKGIKKPPVVDEAFVESMFVKTRQIRLKYSKEVLKQFKAAKEAVNRLIALDMEMQAEFREVLIESGVDESRIDPKEDTTLAYAHYDFVSADLYGPDDYQTDRNVAKEGPGFEVIYEALEKSELMNETVNSNTVADEDQSMMHNFLIVMLDDEDDDSDEDSENNGTEKVEEDGGIIQDSEDNDTEAA